MLGGASFRLTAFRCFSFFFLLLFPCHNEVKSICLPEGFVIKQIKCRRKLLGCVPYFCCQKIGVEKTAANVSLIITNDIRFIFYANLGRNSIFELSALYLHALLREASCWQTPQISTLSPLFGGTLVPTLNRPTNLRDRFLGSSGDLSDIV